MADNFVNMDAQQKLCDDLEHDRNALASDQRVKGAADNEEKNADDINGTDRFPDTLPIPASSPEGKCDDKPKDETDNQIDPSEPEPMETDEVHKDVDDGVVDVSGILKDIDDFNRSAEPTPPPEPLEANEEPEQTRDDSKEEAMEVEDTPVEGTRQVTPQVLEEGKDEVPDTSQAIAALKSLESYDDVDSATSNEPEQFSEDIVDDDKNSKSASDETEKVSGVEREKLEPNDGETRDVTQEENKDSSENEVENKLQKGTESEKNEDKNLLNSDKNAGCETNQDSVDAQKETSGEKLDDESGGDEKPERDTSEKSLGEEISGTDQVKSAEESIENAEVKTDTEVKHEEKVAKTHRGKSEETDDKKDIKPDIKGTQNTPKSQSKAKTPQTCIVCKKAQCNCWKVTPKKEPPDCENGLQDERSASSVRRNTPRAARKRRSFASIYDSDNESEPEVLPQTKNRKVKSEPRVKTSVVNGKTANAPRRSKSRESLTGESENTSRRSRRERKPSFKAAAQNQGGIQIANVCSLATKTGGKKAPVVNSTGTGTGREIIVQPPPPKDVRNKSLLCKPFTQTKATSCRPHSQTKDTQTDDGELDGRKVIIPVPVPVYIPVPMAMYSVPQPYPLPIPVPIPVPFFIPTTKKSADSILKHIKEIQERMPADPFEAEMLMMAEAVAVAEKGSDDSSDESDTETKHEPSDYGQHGPMQGGVLGEDMLQMALRMAQEMPDEALDLEHSINPSTINPDAVQPVQPVEFSTIAADTDVLTAMPRSQSRKRRGATSNTSNRGRSKNKRTKQEENVPEPPPQPAINQPPPDANMVLKYTYGVNAWKHWVVNKNQQLQQASTGRSRLKLFKTDLLQCTADELNYSLCLFVKEVRKPNGDEYAPDSIYYLCLGIQQYLFENGRIDNIFTDIYYEKFTECLNEVLQNYEVRLNTAGLIVCRIEEEHLWESKQLGAHSPHVLLNTLIYFNTKYFMLKTPEEHLRLSFSHIMKHWKKTNVPGTKTPGRSVYLRYYAPVPNAKDAQKRKREELPVFEQAENVENPLRCPVKLYEFYLSKAPESIKNRNDVFYLVPERSCVPDSPVWYSTGNLGIESMTKMLNRIRVVREIQEAHLHHQPMYGLQ